MYDETPLFFDNGAGRLFGILHKPDGNNNGFGFVMCTPIVEEKLWTHRVFVNFARELAAKGYTILRFDYLGHGDSYGDHVDSSPDTMLRDIHSAIGQIQRHDTVKETGLIGLRMGATLAALAAERNPDLKKLVLWEPVLDGSAYMKELFRTNIITQTAVYKEIRWNTEMLIERLEEGGTVNINGYEILLPFYKQMVAVDLLSKEKIFRGEVLLVEAGKRKKEKIGKIVELAKLYKDATCSSVVEQPFWKEIKEYYPRAANLQNTTLQWLGDE